MVTSVQRWGNSQGLRLSKAILADARLCVGDEVDVMVRKGDIVISPAKRIRGKHNLRELVKRIPKNYKPGEADWGRPVGKEAW